jgi:hypothetical protein
MSYNFSGNIKHYVYCLVRYYSVSFSRSCRHAAGICCLSITPRKWRRQNPSETLVSNVWKYKALYPQLKCLHFCPTFTRLKIFSTDIFNLTIIKFHESPCSRGQVVASERTGGRTDMILTALFESLLKLPKCILISLSLCERLWAV